MLILGLWTALLAAVAVASCRPAAAPTPGLPSLAGSPIRVPISTPTPAAVEIPETEPSQKAGVSESRVPGPRVPGGDPGRPNQPLAEQPDSPTLLGLPAPGSATTPTPSSPAPTTTPTRLPPPTSTPTPPPTNTPIPTATPLPPPTATPLPTATPMPPPTALPLPTATPLPPPTPTPTAQPTATPCPQSRRCRPQPQLQPRCRLPAATAAARDR